MTVAATPTTEWLDRALDGNPVWNVGQLHPAEVRSLDRAVRAGKLLKARVCWMFMGNRRAVWYREGFEPQEVMAAQYYAQKASA